MQAGTKICPLCGRSTPLDAVACPGCGHQYRTQFAPSLPQTQMLPPPAKPNSSFAVPAYPQPPAPTVACLHCHQSLPAGTVVCGYCGVDQRPGAYPVYAPQLYPPQPTPPSYPPAYLPPLPVGYTPVYAPAYALVRPPDDFEMFDLVRQYRATKNRFIWMLALGLLLCWPLLIVAYLDHKKMNEIKSRVALRGIHPDMWISRM